MPDRASRRGFVSRLRSGVRAFLLSEEPPESVWKRPGIGRTTLSGVAVTDQTALRVTAVLSCVKVLAESISTLPLTVFERQANGDRRLAAGRPLRPSSRRSATPRTDVAARASRSLTRSEAAPAPPQRMTNSVSRRRRSQ